MGAPAVTVVSTRLPSHGIPWRRAPAVTIVSTRLSSLGIPCRAGWP
jgi:hypothetical protein